MNENEFLWEQHLTVSIFSPPSASRELNQQSCHPPSHNSVMRQKHILGCWLLQRLISRPFVVFVSFYPTSGWHLACSCRLDPSTENRGTVASCNMVRSFVRPYVVDVSTSALHCLLLGFNFFCFVFVDLTNVQTGKM